MHKILVATDGSDTSNRAIDFAVELAKAEDAPLVLLTVVQETSLIPVPMGVMAEVEGFYLTQRDVLEKAAAELIEQAATRAEIAGAETEALVRFGSAARTIVETAEEVGADVIVLGRRGLGDFGGLILGSVTHKVAHLAELPVITVP